MGLENPLHIMFLLAFVLIVFGAKRLPELGRSLGSGMREFKDGVTGAAGAPALPEAGVPAVAQAEQSTQAPASSAR